MKNRYYAMLGGAVLATGLIITLTKNAPLVQKPSTGGLPKSSGSSVIRPADLQPFAETFAATGTLWEPGAQAHDAKRISMPIDAHAFDAVKTANPGDRLTFHLSDRIKPLQGTVTNAAIHEDGTSVVHIQIEGPPAGELIVQENQEAGFFLGQLYYEGLPIAYEFKQTSGNLTAERHLVSDLVCSTVSGGGSVDNGLPVIAEGKKTKSSSSNSAPTATLSNGTVTEGDSGTKNLSFSLNLSSTLKKKVTFTYSVASGTATAGSDFTAKSGTVSLTSSAVISIPILPDTTVEGDETFTLTVSNATYDTLTATGTILNDDSVVTTTGPVFNSLPAAESCVYLDFDGQVVSGTSWYGGGTINAAASGLSSTQIEEVWKRVSEDYAPFQLNVTTDPNVYAAAPTNRRIRCIITPTHAWFGSAGGVAYVSSFTWTGDTPCWVFSDLLSNSARFVGDAVSHEVGHTLGLSHDGNGSTGYYEGQGSGATGWAPIMGAGYYKSLVQWSKGEYPGANNKEDDLAIISGQNGFTYRVDDHGNTPATAAVLNGKNVSVSGVITTREDVDDFSFTTQGGTVSFTITTATPSGNLDVQARLVDASGTTLATVNPTGSLNATLSSSLAAGTYYLVIDGVGEGTASATGYTDYASLGVYFISGTVP